MKNTFRPSLAALFYIAPWLFACSSSSNTDATTTNGVDDVTKACDIRATWSHASTQACTQCIAFASVPRCPCQDEDYAGKCNSQQVAKNQEPSCNDIDTCVGACKASDCACVEACYDGKGACRPLAAAVDGCLAATCDTYCR